VRVGVGVGWMHPPWVQESQQLVANCGKQALPPSGALHFSTEDLMLHRVTPVRPVRQHGRYVAGRPQVERRAQRMTVETH
jgi:hypothetical protein